MVTYLVTIRTSDELTVRVTANSVEEAEKLAMGTYGMDVERAGETYEEVLSTEKED